MRGGGNSRGNPSSIWHHRAMQGESRRQWQHWATRTPPVKVEFLAELHLLHEFTRVILDDSCHTQVMSEDLQRCLDMLEENVPEVRKKAENALIAICQSILTCPDDMQYRELHLDAPIIAKKLLPAIGGMECLFNIGFTEAADCLVLPQDASLSKLQALCSSLYKNSSRRDKCQ